jgi:ABC-type transport system involved in multi-copper enzyme maturation permease subunit
MKYLAILRDSVLEAIDTKVFYFMMGLSFLVILIIASVSYRPVSVEEEVTTFTESMSALMDWASKGRAPHWAVTGFQQTNDAAEPWNGDYRFTFVVRFQDEEEAKSIRAQKKGTSQEIQRMLRQRLSYLSDLSVTETESPDPKETHFQVSSKGSKVKGLAGWPHEPKVFFVLPIKFLHLPLGGQVHFIEDTFVNTIGAAVALLVSTIITAFFIPNMLRKGTIDLLLAKPIHRTTLLIYKFIGGMVFMFLNTTFVVVGVWAVLGARSGLWGAGFLCSILVLTFQFALYYSVSTLFAVLTRSPIVAILMASLTWLILFAVGLGYRFVDATRLMVNPEIAQELGMDAEEAPKQKPLPNWAYVTADTVHFILPRLKDLDMLTSRLIIHDLLPAESQDRKIADKFYASFKWSESLVITSLYIVAFVGLACWRFAVRDY